MGPSLPPKAICREAPDGSAARAATPSRKTRSVGTLFRDFVAFYGGFDAKREAVSVRSGRRAAPSLRLPLHVVLREDRGAAELAPPCFGGVERVVLHAFPTGGRSRGRA